MLQEKVTLREKIGYGFGDAASSMYWKIFGMYLLFFYTDVFILPAAAVGTMFLITRVWDSLFDPVVGVIADRTETRWGKFRPYLLYTAVPFGLIGIATFYVPEWSATGKLVYAYITYSLMMMVYSVINVPYASLLGVMSADSKTRTTLSTFRMLFAFMGSLVALWLIEPLVKSFGDGKMTSGEGWNWAIIIFSITTTILFWLCFAWTKERVKPIREQKNPLKDDVSDLISNKPWWILLGAGIAALIFNSIRDGAAVYYFKYFIQNDKEYNFFDSPLSLTTIYLVLGQAANIIGVIAATPVSNKIGKKKTYLLAMVLATILSIIFYFLNKNNVALIMVFQVLISTCAGAIFPLLWSMYADIADYSEWKQGRRATGLIFSSSSMSQKFGWTLGGALTGWLLAWFGFKANEVQTVEAQNGIRLMLSVLPAIGTLLSVLFISFYPLTENKMKEISGMLDEKRQSANNNSL